jgi:hypothetical protein
MLTQTYPLDAVNDAMTSTPAGCAAAGSWSPPQPGRSRSGLDCRAN